MLFRSVDLSAAGSGSSPFSHLQTLSSPNIGAGEFGSQLLAEDLDNDGLADLVVADPHAANGGEIWVYRGKPGIDGVNADPLVVSRSASSSLGGVMDDRFGQSMDAGPILFVDTDGDGDGDMARNALVVGAPLYDHQPTPTVSGGLTPSFTDSGAVCQFTFSPYVVADTTPEGLAGIQVNGDSWCQEMPGPAGWADYEEFGATVSVGNFIASDANRSIYSDASLLSDIAVGVPGYNAERGRVWVFPAQQDGLDLDLAITNYSDPGAVPGDRFGEVVAEGYAGEALWADLAVGQPNLEKVSLSAAVGANATNTCPELEGWWVLDGQQWVTNVSYDPSIDSDGDGSPDEQTDGSDGPDPYSYSGYFGNRTTEVLVWEEASGLRVAFQDPFYFNVAASSSDSEPCSRDLRDHICQGYAKQGWDPKVVPEGETEVQVALDGQHPFVWSSFSISEGTILELPGLCSAVQTSPGVYEWTNVPVGQAIVDNFDPDFWAILQLQNGPNDYFTNAGDSASTPQGALADVTIQLTPGAGGTYEATLDIDMPWKEIWNEIYVLKVGAACNFGYDTCEEHLEYPSTGWDPGASELPSAALRERDSVCEQ